MYVVTIALQLQPHLSHPHHLGQRFQADQGLVSDSSPASLVASSKLDPTYHPCQVLEALALPSSCLLSQDLYLEEAFQKSNRGP
eukprot:CAMPEP_0114504632 /NCGR_PEP_ID=MMETSP0109-20121206/10373_1 /TAXON_ID=29199 /ORGANISM="Chlorarachnion reptans, Strain CCCM449" /LENGTH=83 /DNA_ID=CAMNT_0001682917 /DNA_START=11 /DNA_END=262 /DNA_ORIENTATION=+